MKKRLFLFLLLGCSVAFSQAKKTAAADPWAGTYKLDTAKSKFHGPAPKEETCTVDAATKTSVKYTLKGTDAEGKAYTVSYDGKPGTPAPVMVDGKETAKLTTTCLRRASSLRKNMVPMGVPAPRKSTSHQTIRQSPSTNTIKIPKANTTKPLSISASKSGREFAASGPRFCAVRWRPGWRTRRGTF